MSGELEGLGVGVHAADMGVEQVHRIGRGTAQLGVEVEATRAETAGTQDRDHGEGELADVGVELVGVPAEQLVTGVGVDRAEHAL